jgi:hypothetical protein
MPANDNELVLRSGALTTLDSASALTVRDASDYELASNYLKTIKDTARRIVDYWKPMKEQAAAAHKSVVAAEKEMLAPLDKAEAILKGRMLAWHTENERIRAEAERERRRLEDIARMKAEEARRLVEEASRKDELDEDDVGILMMAEAEVVAATEAVAPVVVPEAVKISGIVIRKIWHARVVDDKAVPVSIAGIVLRPVDLAALNKLAVASKGSMDVPGVEFYSEDSMAATPR